MHEYFSALFHAGFVVDALREPVPNVRIGRYERWHRFQRASLRQEFPGDSDLGQRWAYTRSWENSAVDDGEMAAMSEMWARSFGSSATSYDDYRPPLPAAVCSWLGVKPDWNVVDVVAGTGQASRVQSASGAHVVAVEADPRMHQFMASRADRVDARLGTAEELPGTAITTLTPAEAAGPVDVEVTDPGGKGPISSAGVFTFTS